MRSEIRPLSEQRNRSKEAGHHWESSTALGWTAAASNNGNWPLPATGSLPKVTEMTNRSSAVRAAQTYEDEGLAAGRRGLAVTARSKEAAAGSVSTTGQGYKGDGSASGCRGLVTTSNSRQPAAGSVRPAGHDDQNDDLDRSAPAGGWV